MIENKINDVTENSTNFYRISGRSTIHKADCMYIRSTSREIIKLKMNEISNQSCKCKRCCGTEKELEKEKYYVVLDLEMCRVPNNKRRSFKHKQETIQIAAVMLNSNHEIISEFSTYVRPEFGSLDYFISNLTGITETQLKSAPLMRDALRLLINWMDQRVDRIYAWSDSDYNQVSFEIKAKELLTEENQQLLSLEWIDYQKTFDQRFSMNRQISLEEALELAEIDAEGRLHDGLDDAINTAQLIQKLENNPEYQLSKRFVEARKEKSNALQFSLGEMFASVFLQLQAQAVGA